MFESIFNENKLPSVSIEGFSETYEKMLRTVLANSFSFEGAPQLRITASDVRSTSSLPTIVIGERHGKKNNVYYLRRPIDISQLYSLAVSLVAESESQPRAKISIAPEEHTISYMKKSISLSELEFKLFSLLYQRQGEIVSRQEINAHLWENAQASNVCDVYVCYLRKKLSELLGHGCISSVRGKGYMLLK